MKRNKIYIEADEELINVILHMIRSEIGTRVRVVDLNPELVEKEW